MYQNRIGILQKTPNISVDLNSNWRRHIVH
jgi:hypothetical protein